jgi:hypothetical protein
MCERRPWQGWVAPSLCRPEGQRTTPHAPALGQWGRKISGSLGAEMNRGVRATASFEHIWDFRKLSFVSSFDVLNIEGRSETEGSHNLKMYSVLILFQWALSPLDDLATFGLAATMVPCDHYGALRGSLHSG